MCRHEVKILDFFYPLGMVATITPNSRKKYGSYGFISVAKFSVCLLSFRRTCTTESCFQASYFYHKCLLVIQQHVFLFSCLHFRLFFLNPTHVKAMSIGAGNSKEVQTAVLVDLSSSMSDHVQRNNLWPGIEMIMPTSNAWMSMRCNSLFSI